MATEAECREAIETLVERVAEVDPTIKRSKVQALPIAEEGD